MIFFILAKATKCTTAKLILMSKFRKLHKYIAVKFYILKSIRRRVYPKTHESDTFDFPKC